MHRLTIAAVAALCLFAVPVRALEPDCRPLESLLAEALDAALLGVTTTIFHGDEAVTAMRHIEATRAAWPRPARPDTIILVAGEGAALAFFAEGVEVCLRLSLTPEGASALIRAVRGEPA